MADFKNKINEIKESMHEPKGYMKIEAYDENDNLVDSSESYNLVMNLQRESMALMQGNVTTGSRTNHQIDSFRIGTTGHITAQEPKPPGTGTNEYNPDMTRMFSESQNEYNFRLDFGNNIQGQANQTFYMFGETYKGDVLQSSNETEQCSMKREVQDRVISFEITIPRGQANPQSASGIQNVGYSEAQLYCGDRIFSMKTFPQKFKDSSVKLVISWQIIF